MKNQIVGSKRKYLSRVCHGFNFYIRIILLLISGFYLFLFKDISYISFVLFGLILIGLFANLFLSNKNYLNSIAIEDEKFILTIKNIKGEIIHTEYPLAEIKLEINKNFLQKFSNEVLMIYYKGKCIKKQALARGWDKSKFEKAVNLIKEKKQELNIPTNNYIKYE